MATTLTSKGQVTIPKRIRDAMNEVFPLSGHDVHVTASMGIVVSPAIYDKPGTIRRSPKDE